MQQVLTDREFAGMIHETRFGSIRDFRLSDGQPVVDDETKISVEYKLSGLDSPQEVLNGDKLLSKPQVRAMLARFRQVGNGTVECLDVRDGLPFKMVVRQKAHKQ